VFNDCWFGGFLMFGFQIAYLLQFPTALKAFLPIQSASDCHDSS
jgi:hypothetical protein